MALVVAREAETGSEREHEILLREVAELDPAQTKHRHERDAQRSVRHLRPILAADQHTWGRRVPAAGVTQ